MADLVGSLGEFLRDLQIAAREVASSISVCGLTDPEQLPEQHGPTVVLVPPELTWSHDEIRRQRILDFVSKVSTRMLAGPRRFRNTLIYLAPVEQDLPWAYRLLLRVRSDGTEPIFLPAGVEPSATSLMKSVWEAAVAKNWIVPSLDVERISALGLLHVGSTIRLSDISSRFQESVDLPMIPSDSVLIDALVRGCKQSKVDLVRLADPAHARLTCRDAELALRDKPDEIGVRLRRRRSDARDRSQGETKWRSRAKLPDRTPGEMGEVVRFPTERLLAPSEENAGSTSSSTRLAVDRLSLTGTIGDEKYGELFRTIVAPLRRIETENLKLTVEIQVTIPDSDQLAPGDPFVRRLRESARRLGLDLDVRVKPVTPENEKQ